MSDDFPRLTALVSEMAAQPVSAAVNALAEHLLGTYGERVLAVLFYGSCLRSGEDRDGIVDLYVLVDSYRRTYPSRAWAALNKLLPPNVYYLEVPFGGRLVRAKYAVLSLADFQRGVSPGWFHSYLWGRFAQPTALLYARDGGVAEKVHTCLATAVMTFVGNVLPQVASPFSDRDLWQRGLTLSYRSELRAERSAKIVRLYDAAPGYYAAVTAAALGRLSAAGMPLSTDGDGRWRLRQGRGGRLLSALKWRLRFVQGKLLSVLRLLKGWATFSGGTDYILWKIRRHTGIAIEVSPFLRRHPLLAACVISWRLYRQGGFR